MDEEEKLTLEQEVEKAKLETGAKLGVKVLTQWLKREKGVEFTDEQLKEFTDKFQAAMMLGLLISM